MVTEIIGQIIGIIFAVFLLILAYKLYAKDRFPSAVLVVWASVFIFLCSWPWFQGWAKSFFASTVTTQLKELGKQVNTVQETTTAMHNQLEKHQTEIDKHQKELDVVQAKIREAELNVFSQQSDITNQFRQISIVQSGLANAQTNLDAQAKQLSDVEYWIKNLFDKTTNETLTIVVTNNLIFRAETNGGVMYIALLRHIPIEGSVELSVEDANSKYPRRAYPKTIFKNVMGGRLFGFDTNTLSMSFHYVIDTRDTNIIQKPPD
jgi:hypothetical protein